MNLLRRNDISPKWNLTLNELTLFNFPVYLVSPETGQGYMRWYLVLGSLTVPEEDFLQLQIQASSVPIKYVRWLRFCWTQGRTLQGPTAWPTICNYLHEGMKATLYSFPP